MIGTHAATSPPQGRSCSRRGAGSQRRGRCSHRRPRKRRLLSEATCSNAHACMSPRSLFSHEKRSPANTQPAVIGRPISSTTGVEADARIATTHGSAGPSEGMFDAHLFSQAARCTFSARQPRKAGPSFPCSFCLFDCQGTPIASLPLTIQRQPDLHRTSGRNDHGRRPTRYPQPAANEETPRSERTTDSRLAGSWSSATGNPEGQRQRPGQSHARFLKRDLLMAVGFNHADHGISGSECLRN